MLDSDLSAVLPSPATVARTLTAMVAEPWPTTEAESHPWLRRHGIDPDTATERDANQSTGRDWDRARMANWGAADAGWGTFGDEFVGVNWFLWRNATSEQVMAAAQELAELITDAHGASTEATESSLHGATWFWQLPGHLIEMYAYHGLPRPDGFPAGDACVQLHLDHRERSEAREREARALLRAERADPDWKARIHDSTEQEFGGQ